MLIKVLSMTPEQISLLAPSERASIMQLVRIYHRNSQCIYLIRPLSEGYSWVNEIRPAHTLLTLEDIRAVGIDHVKTSSRFKASKAFDIIGEMGTTR